MNYKILYKEMLLEELGELIREHRKKKGISQEKLAEECDLSLHHISDIENGKTNPKYDTLIILCVVCEINIGELKGNRAHEYRQHNQSHRARA